MVTCVSTRVANAFENPAASAATAGLPARSSSRIRSKISTLLSTAMPMVSTTPAIPGSVSTAPKHARAAINRTPFSTKRKRCVGTRPPVVNQHRQDHRREPDGGCLYAVLDGIGAQRSLDNSFLDHFDSRRQARRAQVDRQVLSFLQRACTANLAGVANRVLNHRNTENLIVEDNGGTPSDMRLGVSLEPPGCILAQCKRGDRLVRCRVGAVDTRASAQIGAPDNWRACQAQYQARCPSAAGRVASNFRLKGRNASMRAIASARLA